MKAVVHTEYGSPDVLHIQEVEQPSPKANEILIRVRATPVGYGDVLARRFNTISPRSFTMPFFFWLPARLAFGIRKPRKPILGSEFAGEIEGIGSDVTRFKVGDPVFGYRGPTMGAYAEYICMPEDGLVAAKPANMSYEEAAAVPYGALTALSILKRVRLQRGQKVLVNGASGGIGSYAVQLAKAAGAEVTGVCSTPRLELVRSLGADKVIDYTREDFTRNGETYDLIIDILGKSSFARCRRSLKPDGCYLLASFKMRQLFQMLWTSRLSRQKVICAMSLEQPEDLVFIKERVEAGGLQSIIDRCYPLEQAADAHRYAETGLKTGSIVLTVA